MGRKLKPSPSRREGFTQLAQPIAFHYQHFRLVRIVNACACAIRGGEAASKRCIHLAADTSGAARLHPLSAHTEQQQ